MPSKKGRFRERGQAARRDLESSPTPHSSQTTSISDLPLCRRPQGAPTPASSSPQVRDRCRLGAVPRAPVASASASSTRRGARATASSRAGDARPAFWHPIARTPASRALPRRRASFWRHPCEMRRRVAATRGSARSPRARSLPARQAALLSRRRGDESGRRRRSRRVAGGAPLGGAPSRRRADVTGAAAAHDGAQWPPPPSPARPVDQGSGLSAVPSLNRHTRGHARATLTAACAGSGGQSKMCLGQSDGPKYLRKHILLSSRTHGPRIAAPPRPCWQSLIARARSHHPRSH
jgi:hypothetical protein